MPHDPHDTAEPARPFGPALRRALRNRCPACGEAKLFDRFLKPVPRCPHCGQIWSGHQADDFPAYIVIILLGHIVLPVMIETNSAFSISLGVQAVLWPTLTAILALLMIQPVKGGVIALQWARHMHGFAPDKRASETLRAERKGSAFPGLGEQ